MIKGFIYTVHIAPGENEQERIVEALNNCEAQSLRPDSGVLTWSAPSETGGIRPDPGPVHDLAHHKITFEKFLLAVIRSELLHPRKLVFRAENLYAQAMEHSTVKEALKID